MTTMTELDRQISEVVAEQGSRLRNFIRRRVPNEADVEDLLQEVFFKLVEANRLLMPIDTLTGWLFTVARNGITDFFRRKRPQNFSDAAGEDEEGELLVSKICCPPPTPGRKRCTFAACCSRNSKRRWPSCPDQRAVFVAHELEGRSFKELSAETGIKVNTLLSRKRTRCSICAPACRACTTSS